MDRKTYLKRFSRAVRWRLPALEAEEVLSDYADLLGQRPAEDDRWLLRDLGEPDQAARLLSEPRSYRRWLAVFAALAACLVLPGYLTLRAQFYQRPEWLAAGLLLAGTAGSLLWFRPRGGQARQALPKGLLPAMAALLLGLLGAEAVVWSLGVGAWEFIPPRVYGLLARGALRLAGLAAVAAGLWALVQARISDRRWRALYVLALTVGLVCMLVMYLLTSMDLSWAEPDWWMSFAVRWGLLAAVGLLGAGVSLC